MQKKIRRLTSLAIVAVILLGLCATPLNAAASKTSTLDGYQYTAKLTLQSAWSAKATASFSHPRRAIWIVGARAMYTNGTVTYARPGNNITNSTSSPTTMDLTMTNAFCGSYSPQTFTCTESKASFEIYVYDSSFSSKFTLQTTW